ncbi:hypothetical protein DXD90_15085 [Bacteroides uniformis]|jgi:dihydrofolate reductase|uniref:Bacterial bifunctional deaminase-reductase C-terminal domain-containing protein n=3 Tax=Bacteroidales TaxID=171549 RepID=A0A374MQJ2_BACUN|nr:hypothetical protein DXD90_15085 [Bacteroides uniformis]
MGFMLFSDKGMARIRIVMAITLDGFLPKQEEKFMQWLMEEPRKGFPYWKEKASFQINELYGIIDLSDMIRRFSADCICQTIIHDKNSADYADGLFRYNLVDEMVLYTLPISYGKGFSLMDSIGKHHWQLRSFKLYPNGISRLVYEKRRM